MSSRVTYGTQTAAATKGPRRATRASPVPKVPCLPRKVKVDVVKSHVYATQTAAATKGPKRHQSQPSAISATHAMQTACRCRQGPRLPHRMHVDVAKCHACHANSCDEQRTQARHQSQPCAISAMPATQSAARCRQAPTQLDVAKCLACHAK